MDFVLEFAGRKQPVLGKETPKSHESYLSLLRMMGNEGHWTIGQRSLLCWSNTACVSCLSSLFIYHCIFVNFVVLPTQP